MHFHYGPKVVISRVPAPALSLRVEAQDTIAQCDDKVGPGLVDEKCSPFSWTS